MLFRLQNVKTRNKLLFSYILVVFIPVLLVGSILTANMKNMALDSAIKESSNNLDRIKYNFYDVLRVSVDISNKTKVDESVENLVLKKYTSAWEIVEAYKGYREFLNYMNTYPGIYSIKFYANNDTLFDSGSFLRTTKEVADSQWYKNAVNAKGQLCWQYICDASYRNLSQLSLVSYIQGIKSGRPLGVLAIGINSDYLYSMMKMEPFETMIVSDTGVVAASKDLGMEGRTLEEIGLKQIQAQESGISDIVYKGSLSKVIFKTFLPGANGKKFKIMSVFPIKSIIAGSERASKLGFFIITVSLLVAFVLIYIFSIALTKRLKKLSQSMHQVASGDFDFAAVIEGEDEIGQVSKDLVTMAQSIKGLIYENYEVNLQKNQLTIRQKEIKLKMLANQVNPHFLFNALETIRMKAHCKGEGEIAEAVKLLGKIMRRNLEVEKELVTLGEEIELMKSYLDIQKFRFGDKISYEINFEEELKEYRILPLVIQPLVENAMIHGLEGIEGQGKVSVHFQRDHELLSITIEDNGRGMSEQRLQNVRDSLNENEISPGKRIGLINVHQRIKLYYGEAYGLKIDSEINQGTKVEVILPWNR